MPGRWQVLRKMLPFCPLIQVSSVTLLTSKTTWEGKAVRERETSSFWLRQQIQHPGPYVTGLPSLSGFRGLLRLKSKTENERHRRGHCWTEFLKIYFIHWYVYIHLPRAVLNTL